MRFKFELWCIKISDFREKKNKENLGKRIGERAENKKMKQKRASKIATMEEELLSFVRQAICL
jgi:ribosomal protein S25